MKKGNSLADIATTLKGVTRNISIVSSLVKPNDDVTEVSESTLEFAFYAIENQLDRIANDLDAIDLEMTKKETATPTDESKDCR